MVWMSDLFFFKLDSGKNWNREPFEDFDDVKSSFLL